MFRQCRPSQVFGGTMDDGLWRLLPIMAAWRYYVVNRAIERGAVKSERAR